MARNAFYLGKAVTTGLLEEWFGSITVGNVCPGLGGLDDFVRPFIIFLTPSMAGLNHSKFSHFAHLYRTLR